MSYRFHHNSCAHSEMTMRHITTKLKPQLSDHIDSWKNYVKVCVCYCCVTVAWSDCNGCCYAMQLFEFILSCNENSLCFTTQWIYDIVQEFVYQFQGFCQFRSQVSALSSSSDIIRALETNRDAWTLSTVVSILQRLIQVSKQTQGGSKIQPSSPFIVQFGYFAMIELARLECLTGDFTSSLTAISTIKLNDRSELFAQLPVCNFNIFYHTGVCYLMLRQFSSAVDIFTEIVLHVSRLLKPGASSGLRAGLQPQLSRMLDKALALTVISTFLCPNDNLDEQVKEAIETKFTDKLQKMKTGENYSKLFTEIFEFSAPKFISPFVPDYSNQLKNTRQDAANHMLAIFMTEVEQHHNFHKLRSFLSLYATIDISKMARFNDISELDLLSQLLSYKNKSIKIINNVRTNISDVHYYVDKGSLMIDTSSAKIDESKSQERFFIAGVRKHAQIVNQVNRLFSSLGLD